MPERTSLVAASGPHTVIPTAYGLGPGTVINVTRRGYESYYEYMKSETGYRAWHECLHYKKTVSAYDAHMKHLVGPFGDDASHPLPLGLYYEYLLPAGGPILWDVLGDAGTNFGSWDNPTVGLPRLFDNTGGLYSIWEPSDTEDLCAAAIQAMTPGIKPRLSLVNDLLELRDFKSLPKTIHDALNLLSGSFGSKGWPLRKKFATLGDAYLQKEFNVAPTVADIHSIWKSMFGLRDQVNRLIANERRYLTTHFRVPLSNSAPSSDDTITGTAGSTYYNPYYCRRIVSSEASFSATMDYAYDLNGLSEQQLLFGALMDNLGVNLNPTIIWNAIPWSFVVDWVVSIGKWLDQYKTRLIEPTVLIYRSMYSVHVTRTIDLSLRFNGNVVGSYGPVSRVTEESYVRRFFDPNIRHSLELSGLTPKQWSLVAALYATKARKRIHH